MDDPSYIVPKGAYNLVIASPLEEGAATENQQLLREVLLASDPGTL